MKKKMALSLAFLLSSVFLWSVELDQPMVEIECTIQPIDRSKIHPKGDYATSESISSNWSGYAAASDFQGSSANGTANYVAGSWVVPALVPTRDTTYCAIWVGLDGYQDGTVEQIGTSHDWTGGAQHNYAWFEMYPNGAYEINGFPVDNGDVISARVAYKGDNTFKLVIFNHTKGVSTVIPSSYTMSTSALRSSAEWVVEAPYSGEILPLSDFKLVTFNFCSAVINGVSGSINNGNWMNDEITMEVGSGVKAKPSALLKNGTCFQVDWKHE